MSDEGEGFKKLSRQPKWTDSTSEQPTRGQLVLVKPLLPRIVPSVRNPHLRAHRLAGPAPGKKEAAYSSYSVPQHPRHVPHHSQPSPSFQALHQQAGSTHSLGSYRQPGSPSAATQPLHHGQGYPNGPTCGESSPIAAHLTGVRAPPGQQAAASQDHALFPGSVPPRSVGAVRFSGPAT